MKVSKCRNGHYFDVETYQTCPLCGAEIDDAQQSSGANDELNDNKGSRGRFFKKKGKTSSGGNAARTAGSNVSEHLNTSDHINAKSGTTYDPWNISERSTSQQKNSEPTIGLDEIFKQGTSNNPYVKEKTIDIWGNSKPYVIGSESKKGLNYTDTAPSGMAEEAHGSGREYGSNADATPEGKNVDTASSNDEAKQFPESGTSLSEQVRQVSSSSDGKTMSFFSAYSKSISTNAEEQKSNAILDPVVGWLVCISGEHLGESFSIFSGMNTVGRSVNNKISIRRDPTVSREKHTVITFEPKHRVFYIKPGDSSGLTYVNGNYIMETRKLNDRDIVEIGNSRLMFVPLCDERFAWEDYINAR